MNQAAAILIVDDDPAVRANLADILRDLGYEVVEAASADEAAREARHRRFVCAVVDLRMPGRGGVDLLRELRSIDPRLATIVVTAFASEETEREVRRAGARRLLHKPVDVAALVSTVEGVR